VLFIAVVPAVAGNQPDFSALSHDKWVDSLMNALTIDQKIGQLFMVQVYPEKDGQSVKAVLDQLNQYQVGGILFMQSGPITLAKVCNRLQNSSHIPLMIAIDGESGLGFRLDSTINYPDQQALGAIQNDSLIYRMGYEIGQQCRMLGINMNMAPVADINRTPDNPVINFRSFGQNRRLVALNAWLYAKGMQDAGVLAVAKHFPGHGNTVADSHLSLPVVPGSIAELDSIDLFPFSFLAEKGIGAIMTGHLQVPALEPERTLPASLSPGIIRKKLIGEMGFKGLIITDALNMKGVSNRFSSAESAVKALKAGNDMIEVVPRLDNAVHAVLKAVAAGEISIREIDEKCRKILGAKKWMGLDRQKPVDTGRLYQRLNNGRYQLTKRLLTEQSLTVLKNTGNILPLQCLDTLKIASLAIGADTVTPFQQMLLNYTNVDHFTISNTPTDAEIKQIHAQLENYNLVISGIYSLRLYPTRNFGITDAEVRLVNAMKDLKTITCFFGNPYALSSFPALSEAAGLIVGYQDDGDVQELTAQLIFGATSAHARLPVSVAGLFELHSGVDVRAIGRLKYTLPEELGICSQPLEARLDSLAGLAISQHAFPGCQVLVAKDGKVFFQKCYGWLSYDKKQPVTPETLYDLASLTKILAPLPAIMKLYDEKKINLDNRYADYFPGFRNTNKDQMTIRDVLLHQACLQAFMPLWLQPGGSKELREGAFQDRPSEKYPIRISAGMYERADLKAQLIKDIARSPLRPQKIYYYSDLGFAFFPDIIENLTKQSFQEYLDREFYRPLGAVSTGFVPFLHFPVGQIAPTEDDQYFRHELLQGYVHDETAALLGGVSGNAGLFSNANDLAKVMQMYLQSGYYGGKQYIASGTIGQFTSVQHTNTQNYRGLGFDKPNPAQSQIRTRLPATGASTESFGHTGFTGTFAWADPRQKLLFIFLSNRINPSREKMGIYQLNTRSEMQQAVYDALRNSGN
jgi:beta-glucosidase-like glycosyl hydrolase/CubicO group peptidase (beta-lactamase class C family)